jgi:hypothetical protein
MRDLVSICRPESRATVCSAPAGAQGKKRKKMTRNSRQKKRKKMNLYNFVSNFNLPSSITSRPKSGRFNLNSIFIFQSVI